MGRLVIMAVMSMWAFLGVCEAQEGLASYYNYESCKREGNSGVWTASGERFDDEAMTCAMRRRDFGKSYYVYCPSTNKGVIVRHNDYGPGRKPSRDGVLIDLSEGAFRKIAPTKLGRVKVQVMEIQ